MADRARMRVVEIERVHERAVGQRGTGRGRAHASTDQRRLGCAALRDHQDRASPPSPRPEAAYAHPTASRTCRTARSRTAAGTSSAGARPRTPRVAPPRSSSELELDPGRLVGRAQCDVHRHRVGQLHRDRTEREPAGRVRARDADRRGAVGRARARQSARLSTDGPARLELRLPAARVLDQRQVALPPPGRRRRSRAGGWRGRTGRAPRAESARRRRCTRRP